MRNDLFVSRCIRVSLTAIYILFSVQRLMALGICNENEIVFYTTVDRNAAFLFFGYLCVLFDNGLVRNACCETVFLRYSSKKAWLWALLRQSVIEVGLFCVAVGVLLTSLMLLFGVLPIFSARSALFYAVLFLYSTMLRFILIDLNIRIRNLNIAIGVTLAVNTVALAFGHSIYYPARPAGAEWIGFTVALAMADLLLGMCAFLSLKRYELYSDKNARD